MNRSESSNPSLQFVALVALVLLILAVIGGVFYFASEIKTPVSNVPIRADHVEIGVEFKELSTKNYNDLTTFVRKLAENHTDRLVDDFNGYHGFWNDGFVNRRYHPNHPIPSPEVEQLMAARLDSFLKENGIDGSGVKLELRYGQ